MNDENQKRQKRRLKPPATIYGSAGYRWVHQSFLHQRCPPPGLAFYQHVSPWGWMGGYADADDFGLRAGISIFVKWFCSKSVF